MQWPTMDERTRKLRTELPEGRLDIVLDTDTYNEVDDQFALAYALLSPDRLHMEAIYAAPFHNSRSVGAEDGMEKSYAEIQRLLPMIGQGAFAGPVLHGSRRFMQSADDVPPSPAAEDLVRRAMARPDGSPLYVVAIGAITNIAAALRMEPRIAGKIVIVWLGGHDLHWPDTREFNLWQDVHAARTVFDCGAPVILLPCLGVTSHLITTNPELSAYLGGHNPLCDALVRLVADYSDGKPGWGKPLWDVGAIAVLLRDRWTARYWTSSPLITDEGTWARDESRHGISVVRRLDRSAIFEDLFAKLVRA